MFYLKVRETLINFNLNTLPGEDAVYYQHINGNLIGMLLSHVDDFTITGTNKFVNRIVEGLKKIFTISKIEEDNFRFTGLDVKTTDEGIEVSMEDFAKSIKEIQDIRKASGTEPLTKAELKEYRKHTGKLSWLAQGTRPDLSYSVIDLSKKNNSATIADLRNINRIVDKVKKEENKIIYKKLGNREDLQIIGIVDASYKVDSKSLAGMIIALTNKDMTKASPLMWKTKQIVRVCHSSKDAETLSMTKMIDEITYMARHIEILLYGKYNKKTNVRILTDSEPTLESIASTRQIERKGLRMLVHEMKDKLRDREITSYQWISTKKIWADGLTKEMPMTDGIRNLLKHGTCDMVQEDTNKVICQDDEIKMINIRNRKRGKPEKDDETTPSTTS